MKSWFILLISLLTLGVPLLADDANAQLDSIANDVRQLEKKEDVDPAAFSILIDRFVSIPNDSSQVNWNTLKVKKLDVLIVLLQAMGNYVDFNFDSSQRPTANVAPPLATGFPPGVDPNEITDPVLRAEYEHDIKANHELAQKRAKQHKWQDLFSRLRAQLEIYRKNYFTGDDAKLLSDKVNTGFIDNKPFLQRLEGDQGSNPP